ncbi:MAG: restriction endonuclease subunit S [Parcubacteria group bacterium]
MEGVEWVEIGELCELMTGGTPTSTKKEYYEDGKIKWLVSGDIHKGKILECKGRITELGMESSNARLLPKDSVLIALNGQGKTRGTVALLKTEATCNQSLVAMIPKDNKTLMPDFLYIVLRSMYQEIRNITGDTQRSGLNMPIIRKIKIPLAPLEVQKEFVVEAEKEEEIIEANRQLIEVMEGKIDKLLNEI